MDRRQFILGAAAAAAALAIGKLPVARAPWVGVDWASGESASFITGIGRGSPYILDNRGLRIDFADYHYHPNCRCWMTAANLTDPHESL